MRRVRASERDDAITHALARAEQGEGQAEQTDARHGADRESGM
jgi:hypothetical protein